VRVLGIDPGSHECAATLIDRESAFRGKWLESHTLPARFEGAHDLLVRLKPDFVVVEQPVWIGLGKGAAELMTTGWHGGGWMWLARALGMRAEAIYAREWRKWLTGDVSPSDAKIATALGRVLSDIPTRSTNHARDAAGVAWSGLRLPADWTERRRRVAEMKSKAAGAKAYAMRRMKARVA
jgi:Holliday junction resolvasome RuvABC endonuclease subunit